MMNSSKDSHSITQMLMQLVPMAAERDAELAYFVTIAAAHSADLDMGTIKAKPIKRAADGIDQASDEACLLSKAS